MNEEKKIRKPIIGFAYVLSLILIALISGLAFHYLFKYYPSSGHINLEDRGPAIHLYIYAVCELFLMYTSIWLLRLFPAPTIMIKDIWHAYKKVETWEKAVYPFVILIALTYLGALLLVGEVLTEQLSYLGLVILGASNVFCIHNLHTKIIQSLNEVK